MRQPDDPTRFLKGPHSVEVYVPPKPPDGPDDMRGDFPPGEPPVVRYDTVEANYWQVLREVKMAYMGREKIFGVDEMKWLRDIESEVEAILSRWKSALCIGWSEMGKAIPATLADAKWLCEHSFGFKAAVDHLTPIAFRAMAHQTSGTIDPNDVKQMGVVIPRITLAAFRLELLLKVLSILDHGQYEQEHDLARLFDALKPNTQQRIEAQFKLLSAGDSSLTASRPNFDTGTRSILEKSSKAFVKFRYFPTEKFEDLHGFVADDVVEAAAFSIWQDHPEWFS